MYTIAFPNMPLFTEMRGFGVGRPRGRIRWTRGSPRPIAEPTPPAPPWRDVETQPIRVAEMSLNQDWEQNRRTMNKTGARKRESYPGYEITSREEMLAKINRIVESGTSRTGVRGIIEATTGIGGTQESGTTRGNTAKQEWFVPFVEEYKGRNPVIIGELERRRVRALLDTGAQVHIIGNITLQNLLGDFSPLMRSTRTTATDVKGRPVPIMGTTILEVNLDGSTRNLAFEVIEGADTLIIGNKILYDEDLVLIGRKGLGTKSMAAKLLSDMEEATISVYATQDELIERGDCKRITVRVKGPRRNWGVQVNRIFLIDSGDLEGLQFNPTISHLNEEGELVAIVSNEDGTQDITIEKGTMIAKATTEYDDGEELVTETMAELAAIQADINHISASEIVQGERMTHNTSTDVMPPGFQVDGPQPGGLPQGTTRGKYDSERENEGGTWETAHIHFKEDKHIQDVRSLLHKHQKMFSKHNYDIGHFAVNGVVQKVKLKVTDKTPIVERYRQTGSHI